MSSITLLYPPQQTHPSHGCKPEASLAYPYLAGALLDAGHEVSIYDACVGNDHDPEDTFYRYVEMDNGLRRHGVSDERILEEVADSDIVGVTSIFTNQETMAIHVGKLIKGVFPEKLLVAGGTNAQSRYRVFLSAGFDVVCTSESERTIVRIADQRELYCGGKVVTSPITEDLDDLPIPAWHLHANDRYWKIGRPHGASRQNGQPFQYASIMTSRGCIFNCSFCHISGDLEAAEFRTKSFERVELELQRLRDLGVENVFVEDDTLFGRKHRAIKLLRRINGHGFRMWDINGINLVHLFRCKGRHYYPDTDLLDELRACRFVAVSLPVESASQRIIDRYASKKWRVDRLPVASLIKALSERGISVGVNYMIGYPDETPEEVQATIDMAREHMTAGATSANFMLVIPLPGTSLHQEAVDRGYLDRDFNPDTFNWRRANMKNTTIPPERLEEIRQTAWQEMNA